MHPKELLLRPLRWQSVELGRWEADVDNVRCQLVMNDFPDEPLYTLTVENRSLDIDDPPKHWTIERT